MSAPTQVSSGIGTISGIIRVNALPTALFRGLSGAEGVLTDYSGAINVNISGGNLSALMSGVSVSVSGDVVLVVSGGTIQISGIVTINSGIITNVASGTVNSYRWEAYALRSLWSGAVGKDLIGIYHAGGAAGKSGVEVEITGVELGIWGSGNVNRFDIIHGSGVVSGSAGTIITYRTADTASVVSGVVDGSTIVSGQFSIQTVTSIIAEANSSGIMHNYAYGYPNANSKMPRILSGQCLYVRMVSGIGIGTATLEWVERYP